LRLTGQKLADQRLLFLGAGSAATGIAELVSLAMAREGADLAEARRRNALFDVNGLPVTGRTDLADFQSRSPKTGSPFQPSSRPSRRSGRRASSASAPFQSCLPAR
jgi:malate dehydrogenase (oxaloacetate-decarboxylating)(NADP+)